MAEQGLTIVGRVACEHCGRVRPGVRYTEDPLNRDVMMYLCEQCLQQRAEDI